MPITVQSPTMHNTWTPRTPAEHFAAQLAGDVPTHVKFGEAQDRRIEDYPWLWMPPDALPLNKSYTIAAPAIGSTGTQIGSFTPDTNWWAVIRWLTLMQTGPNFPEGTAALTWRISGSIVPQEVAPIIIRPNSKVIFQVDNGSWNPAGVNVIAVARGWEWPSRQTRL